MLLRPFLLALLFVGAGSATLAQTPEQPAFDAASIHVHQGPLHEVAGFHASGPRISFVGDNLRLLVQEAYGRRMHQVVFDDPKLGPDEDQNTNYDINAVAPGEGVPTRQEFDGMLQTLLADRFKLRFHHEMRTMSVYALVVGKIGPKFKPSAPDAVSSGFMGVNGRNQTANLMHATMDALAEQIVQSFMPRLPVINRTELSGFYDIKLEATPEFRIANSQQPTDISVFDAVQDQLGLKLETQKADIDVLVVDHIERPSES